MSLSVWLAFLVTTLLFSLFPGAGALNTMGTVVRHGVRSALPSIAGLQLGLLCHLLLAGVGLGALLARSLLLFEIIKWCGAAYLVWLGWKQWRAPVQAVKAGAAKPMLFWPAVLVNLTNPKTILFLVALFPQFIHTDYPLWSQCLILGATCLLVDALVMVGYATLAVPLMRIITTPARQRLQNRVFGSLFMAAGVTLAGASR